MRALLCALAASIFLATAAVAADYRIVGEQDSSFGNVRTRVTLEIEIPSANPIARETIEIMMQAAVDRHRVDWSDAVSVRLWKSYGDDSIIRNMQQRLVYTVDGCGWTGDDCSDELLWTDLDNGEFPNTLGDFGRPTEDERKAAEKIICRQDLQCWGEKHLVSASFACQPLIESMAKYDYDWTDGFFEQKLDRWRWDDRRKGSLSFKGDKVKFQNVFGAWQRMSYWCHYDPATETARAMVNAR